MAEKLDMKSMDMKKALIRHPAVQCFFALQCLVLSITKERRFRSCTA